MAPKWLLLTSVWRQKFFGAGRKRKFLSLFRGRNLKTFIF